MAFECHYDLTRESFICKFGLSVVRVCPDRTTRNSYSLFALPRRCEVTGRWCGDVDDVNVRGFSILGFWPELEDRR